MSFYLSLPLCLRALCSLPFSPPSSPNLRLTALPLREVDQAYLCSCKHSFTVAVLHSSVHSFYSSSAVLLTSLRTSPFSSSFQFPLLKWDVVYWGECVHSLSPAPVWVLVGRNGPVMKQSTAVQTHTNQVYRSFGVCVGVYVCVRLCMHMYILTSGWLRSPSVSSHYFCRCPFLSLSVILICLFLLLLSYYLSLFLSLTVCPGYKEVCLIKL